MEMLFLLALPFLAVAFGGGGGSHDDGDPDGIDHPGEEFTGTEADDVMAGGDLSDQFDAGGGNDLIDGLGGNDTISAGAGDDAIRGGAGDDVVYLGDGDDVIQDRYADENDDLIYDPDSSAGDDLIYGGSGADVVVESNGSDALYGGTGTDILWTVDAYGSHEASDINAGGWGSDTMFGDDGDAMTGNQGNDHFGVWIDQTTDRPVTITDFNGDDDTLALNVDSYYLTAIDYTGLSSSVDEVSGDVTVSVAGRAVAVLNKPLNFDLSKVEFYIDNSNGQI